MHWTKLEIFNLLKATLCCADLLLLLLLLLLLMMVKDVIVVNVIMGVSNCYIASSN